MGNRGNKLELGLFSNFEFSFKSYSRAVRIPEKKSGCRYGSTFRADIKDKGRSGLTDKIFYWLVHCVVKIHMAQVIESNKKC